MGLDRSAEAKELPERPLSQMRYNVLVFLGVVLNAFLMILSLRFSNPSPYNPQGYSWFLVSVYIIVPDLGSFVYSLFASITTPRKYTISPVYIVFFSIIPAYLIGSYVTYEIYGLQPINTRISEVINYLYIVTLLYLLWIAFSIVAMQPIIRGLIGAFAERENIKSGTLFYNASISLGNVLEKIEDSKWLSDLCSMEIADRKEKPNELQLRLNKHETDFYIALYAKKTNSETHVSLTPYEMEANPAKKIIHVSDDSKSCLQPQIEQLERTFKLNKVQAENSDIVYEAVNYAMSPARFPAIVKYGKQISVASAISIASILVIILYFTGLIKELQTTIGIIAIMVALGSTAINLLSRK